MGAIASGRLAVAPDPVAGDRQHERRETEPAERRGVDEQPGEEASACADDRPAEERDGDEHHEQHIRHASEHVHLREDRDLHDRREEEERGGLDAVDDVHGSFGVRFVATRAATESSEPSDANGVTCTVR